MKNHKKIRRIFEQEMTGVEPMAGDAQMTQPEQMLPDAGELSTPVDPMSMTVRDFLAKCKSIDPLVCMGIETFISQNGAQFGQDVTPAMPPQHEPMHAEPAMPAEPATQDDADLSFSANVEPSMDQPAPTPAEPFSLEQPEDALNFPTA